MTSPRDAHRLVGHSSPQPEAGNHGRGSMPAGGKSGFLNTEPHNCTPAARDIVERLRDDAGHCDLDHYDFDMAVDLREAADEIDRLRTALRAVRACTDPAWASQIISDALREEAK